jgi:hypothetical protein
LNCVIQLIFRVKDKVDPVFNHLVIKNYGGLEVNLHTFLTLALLRGNDEHHQPDALFPRTHISAGLMRSEKVGWAEHVARIG